MFRTLLPSPRPPSLPLHPRSGPRRVSFRIIKGLQTRSWLVGSRTTPNRHTESTPRTTDGRRPTKSLNGPGPPPSSAGLVEDRVGTVVGPDEKSRSVPTLAPCKTDHYSTASGVGPVSLTRRTDRVVHGGSGLTGPDSSVTPPLTPTSYHFRLPVVTPSPRITRGDIWVLARAKRRNFIVT